MRHLNSTLTFAHPFFSFPSCTVNIAASKQHELFPPVFRLFCEQCVKKPTLEIKLRKKPEHSSFLRLKRYPFLRKKHPPGGVPTALQKPAQVQASPPATPDGKAERTVPWEGFQKTSLLGESRDGAVPFCLRKPVSYYLSQEVQCTVSTASDYLYPGRAQKNKERKFLVTFTVIRENVNDVTFYSSFRVHSSFNCQGLQKCIFRFGTSFSTALVISSNVLSSTKLVNALHLFPSCDSIASSHRVCHITR